MAKQTPPAEKTSAPAKADSAKVETPAEKPVLTGDAAKSPEDLKAEWKKLKDGEAANKARVDAIETELASRLVKLGKGKAMTMPDGHKYRGRKYGDDIEGPMRGKTILVVIGATEEAAL